VTGIEILAKILHPKIFTYFEPQSSSFSKI